jgi:hypothetical protein
MPVPPLVLDSDSLYFWRVRCFDSAGRAGPWSNTRSFRTMDESGRDLDSDGIFDEWEIGEGSDVDENGQMDHDQPELKCVRTAVGDTRLCIKAEENVFSIDSLYPVDPNDLPDTEEKPLEMPMGMISVSVRPENPDLPSSILVFFPKKVPTGAWWYVYTPENGWKDVSEMTGFDEQRQSMVLEFSEGKSEDADGAGNGTAVIISGLTTKKSQPASFRFNPPSDDVDSCFIKSLLP